MKNDNVISQKNESEITLRVWMFKQGESIISVRYHKMPTIVDIPLGQAANREDLWSVLVGFQKMGYTHVYINHVYRKENWVKYSIDNFQLSSLNKATSTGALCCTI